MQFKGYIINPDPYLMPQYRLSPFGNTAINLNRNLKLSEACDLYFKKKHQDLFFEYTYNGREAINIALSCLKLKENDLVSILSTTQNFYISSCVTKEIEQFCKWNREIVKETTVIFVNHEFGFPYEELDNLKRYNLPIIEDCAYAFNSNNTKRSVGKVGDFVIYSFPKFFPIQIGGLLVSTREMDKTKRTEKKDYIKNVISYYVDSIDELSDLRIKNYNYLKEQFERIGLQSRFGSLDGGVVPGSFMFTLPQNFSAQSVKEFLYRNGVECSVFYGENAVFIPCHNYLEFSDLDYFTALIDFYITNN